MFFLDAWGQSPIFATKFNIGIMTDYEYILKQVKLFHYKGWEAGELRKCVDMLPNLTREELSPLYRSRWLKEDKTFREAIFNTLFKNQIGKRESRIKEMDTASLIEEFKDKKSGNVALIRNELRERYKANKDKPLIIAAFENSNKSDQQWVKNRIKEENEGVAGKDYVWVKKYLK